MLIHSFMAGAAAFTIVALFTESAAEWMGYLKYVLMAGIGLNLFTILIELTTTHPTEEAHLTVKMITKGRYRQLILVWSYPFW